MRKTPELLKMVALVAVLALAVVGLLPSPASAEVAEAAAADRDCDLTDNDCFARVKDDGTVVVYHLGNLLAN